MATLPKTEDLFFQLFRKNRWSHRTMMVYAYRTDDETTKHNALLEGYYSYPGITFPVRFYEEEDFSYKKKRDFLRTNVGQPMLITDDFKRKLGFFALSQSW